MPLQQDRPHWAAQRIKGLCWSTAVWNAARRGNRGGGDQIKTLIEEFEYPRLGPGMMWEAFAADVERNGGARRPESPTSSAIEHDGDDDHQRRLLATTAPSPAYPAEHSSRRCRSAS